MKKLVLLIFLVTKAGAYAAETPRVSIVCDPTPAAPVVHGLDKLSAALEKQHILFEKVHSLQEAKGTQLIVTGEAATPLLQAARYRIPDSAEALIIRKTQWKGKPVWLVAGHDDRGLMYGLLDIADRIGWATNTQLPFSALKETSESPHVAERAISIYTMNRTWWESRFYDEQYWTRYLDMLAADRFNTLVVIFGYENGGFLAPCYPYFFNVDGFPDVRMVGLSEQQQQKNLAAFNRLIQMAHDRGIRFTVGIWDHIYRGGVQGGGIPGTKDSPDQPTQGLVWGLNGDNLVPYTKAALTKFVKEVPGLDAIQFRMHDESGLKKDEQDTFWSDIFRMMKATKPDLLLDLRVKELKESIIKSALDVGVKFRLNTKYWMEQMGLPYHPTQINPEKSPRRHSYSDLLRYPQRYKMHWQLWSGGTSRILLWGDPEYVRRFAESTHLYDGDGYEVNEPLATKMEAQPHDAKPFDLLNPQYRYYDYEFERYWHFFQVFGRIGYDPKTPAMTWDQEFVKRFGPRAAPFIEQALHKASWVLPRIIASCYPYSAFPTTRGWAEKQALGDLPSYAKAEGSDLMQFANPDDEAKLLIEGGATPRLLPSANSKWLLQVSTEINQLVAAAKKNKDHPSKEFTSTVTDLSILSQLALYHSRRITAAVSYRIFERTQSPVALDDAIAGEKKAIDAWRGIVTAAGDVYTDDLAMGVRVADLCGHWKDELPALEEGLKKLEDKRRGLTTSSNAPHYDPQLTKDNHSLFRITDKPVGKHATDEPITIRIKVTAAVGIKWVHLRCRAVNQEQEYQTLPMLPSAEKDVYEATVPAAQINPEWDLMYLFEVMDNNNKGAVFPDVSKETPYHIIRLQRQQRMTGSPLDHLPANIEILTHFGERADFSPDNQRIAFMTKSFGDAMVMDLKTREIRCLTCNIPAAAFLRVMHLPSGDYILIGPEKFEDIETSRTRDNELWFLSKERGSKPVRLGVKMSEGMAISKKNMRIAYTQLHAQDPTLGPDASRLVMADVDVSGGTPKITNKTTIYESADKSCALEAQDFYDNDTKMTFICYEPEHLASVMTIDLETKAVVNQSKKPGSYNECEGILPGGQYTLVEGDRQCETYGGKRGPWNIDIYRLKLDGTGKNFERLTRFNDYEGGKASNPVASTDGRYMAFQFANTADPAGVGYGLLLYKFIK